ncbi:MAG: GDSL-type esterase/lipase family protein [Blastocatellia bacterium]
MFAFAKIHALSVRWPAALRRLPAHPLLGKTSQTIFCVALLSLVPYVLPGMERWRLLPIDPPHTASPAQVAQTTTPVATQPDKQVATQTSRAGAAKPVAPAKPQSAQAPAAAPAAQGEIEDSSGRALQAFFTALAKSETGQTITRVAHYGDSPITGDSITSTIRQKLQARFGDAGHGFVLTARPWGWYNHIGVRHNATGAWHNAPLWLGKSDHLFGYGAVSFTARDNGATAMFGPAEEGTAGRNVTAYDIYYLQQPGGGDFTIEFAGAERERVSTKADVVDSGFHRVTAAPDAGPMTLRPAGNGEVRMFGVVLESGAGGVQYDSLGNNGAFIGLLADYMDEQHWAQQLRHRRPDLVILNYGTNESQFDNWPMDKYERDTREVVRRLRAALPEASVLFIGPMDRGVRGPGGSIITRPTIPGIVAAQRRLAAETGCAFFDAFTAMGGAGTVARWREARPALMSGDLTHPAAAGSETVGALIHDALIRAYEKHKRPTAPQPAVNAAAN